VLADVPGCGNTADTIAEDDYFHGREGQNLKKAMGLT
jgi:hypothetical protein